MTNALLPLLVFGAVMLAPLPAVAAPHTPDMSSRTGTFEQSAAGSAPTTAQRPARTQNQPTLQQSAQITATRSVTVTQPLTGSVLLTDTVPLTATTPVTATAVVTTAQAVDEAAQLLSERAATPDATALDDEYSGVLVGTILANRTDAQIRFFVEGQTYEIAPLRALGLELPRETAVLNLFNCEASKSDTDAGCFWDPYLLTRDGFYEVIIGQELGEEISLALQEAGAPPSNQIWIQNRTGERESVIVNNEVFEVAPSSVQEVAVNPDAPVIVQLRNCIVAGAQSICEWAPQGVEAGYYYGLVRNDSAGPNNTQLTGLALQGVIASSGETIKPPPQALCRLRVPTLNVRSGPGLEFDIIAKIRGTESEPGSVVVTAVDNTAGWMKVTERVARDGWVTADPEYILCEGDLAALPVIGLPVVEATEAPVAEATEAPVAEAAAPVAEVVDTPAPVEVEAAPVVEEAAPVAVEEATPATAEEGAPAEESTPTPETPEVPEGLARIVVNNPFDQQIRFTLDQKFRPERENLSGEWDLMPGESVAILVYPGTVAFSVSTPWRGLSDNAEFVIAEKEERALWIWFVPDPVEKDRWNLQF